MDSLLFKASVATHFNGILSHLIVSLKCAIELALPVTPELFLIYQDARFSESLEVD